MTTAGPMWIGRIRRFLAYLDRDRMCNGLDKRVEIVVTYPVNLPKTTARPATLSFDELRAGIQDRYGRLLAIDVEYQTTTEVIRAEPKDAEFIPKTFHRFAFKGERRFRSLALPARDGTEGPPEMKSVRVFDGVIRQTYYPAEYPLKSGSVDNRTDGFADGYANYLAIPTLDAHPALPSPTDYFLPLLLNRTELGWTVGATLERVDDAMCHVLHSNSRESFWIDPELGYSMRFHEAHCPIHGRPAAQWPLSSHEAFRDYRPSRNGVWFPHRVERASYVSTRAPEHLWNHESLRVRHVVAKLAINEDVDDSLFIFSFPVGTTVNDHVTKRFYRVGRGNVDIDMAGPQWYLDLTRRRTK